MIHDTVEVGNHNVIIDINPDNVQYTSMTINVFSKTQTPFYMMVVTSYELDNGFDENNFQFVESGYPTVDIDYVDNVDGYNLVLKSDTVQDIEYKISYQNVPTPPKNTNVTTTSDIPKTLGQGHLLSTLPSSFIRAPSFTRDPPSSSPAPTPTATPTPPSLPLRGPGSDYYAPTPTATPTARSTPPSLPLRGPGSDYYAPTPTATPTARSTARSTPPSLPLRGPGSDYYAPTPTATPTATPPSPSLQSFDETLAEKGSFPVTGIIVIVVSVTVLIVGGVFTFKFLNKNKGSESLSSTTKSPTLLKLENLAI